MKRGDLIIVLLLLAAGLVGLLVYYFTPAAPLAEIVVEVNGQVLETYPLFQKGRAVYIDVQGQNGVTRLQLAEDRVRVVESACPDKICVNTGWIWNSAQTIACLPNRVVIKITNSPSENIDLR